MADTSLWEVQKAIVSTLTGSTTVTSLIGSAIYDEPPTNVQYPYVVVMDGEELPNDNHNRLGFEATCTLFIYTKSSGLGWYQAVKILDAFNEVLNRKRLELDTLFCEICKLDNVIKNRVDETRILEVQYSVLTSKNSLHSIYY